MKSNRKANALLLRKQRTYQNQRRLRKEKTFLEYPELEELTHQMNTLGIELLKETARKNTPRIESIHAEMDTLEKQIDNFIKEHQIEVLSPYFCPLCQDTGYRNHQLCQCLAQCIMETSFVDAEFKKDALRQRFENFDLSLYSETPFNLDNISPRQNAQNIYQIMQHYCNNYSRINDHLLFTGPPGTGKTFTSNCIANDLLEKGLSVIYITASHLIATVQDQLFREKKSQFEVFRPFLLCDLLIIDDLGAEFLSEYGQKQLYEVIDNRLNNQQKMIISTNLSTLKIQELYDERLSSRITGNFKVFPFMGADIRLLKAELSKGRK